MTLHGYKVHALRKAVSVITIYVCGLFSTRIVEVTTKTMKNTLTKCPRHRNQHHHFNGHFHVKWAASSCSVFFLYMIH